MEGIRTRIVNACDEVQDDGQTVTFFMEGLIEFIEQVEKEAREDERKRLLGSTAILNVIIEKKRIAKLEVLDDLLNGHRLEALGVELIPVTVIRNLISELEKE